MKGGFTLPGEAGYEALTLALARKWGADAIRDSDGTALSDALVSAGYDIYATVCLIRSINEWAKQHQDMLQQNLLMSRPVMATEPTVRIDLLQGYSRDQFRVNDQDGIEFWQVFDRTEGRTLPRTQWQYADGCVTVENATRWHRYTVNFFAYRLWEVISMYNHITNGWGDRERLMPVEPRHPQVRAALLSWLDRWCADHPQIDIVRFTSMVYNFAWIWSDDPCARDWYSDWGSYDFSVSPVALHAFYEQTGIRMQSEDFIRGDLRNATHNAPTEKYRQWMTFTHAFVTEFAGECVDIVHRHGKRAYVFYDDTWIGVEPYGERFAQAGFDGIIKCVFGGYETRLCASTPHVKMHEIRLHPYLFPTGLRGEPTFAPGGDPTSDLWGYWLRVRRALLRQPVDRIGLGGYLHLVEPFPDFCDAVAQIADDFRAIGRCHTQGSPRALPGKLAILTEWGDLRAWSTSGHLHEHPEVDLTNVLEALSGMPLDVVFLSFDDVRKDGVPKDIAVLLNAGWPQSAWVGGTAWADAEIVARLTGWVYEGGGLVGIGFPSAVPGGFSPLALGDLFGVQWDDGSRKCMRKYPVAASDVPHFITADGIAGIVPQEGIYLELADTLVLAEQGRSPLLTCRAAGQGRAVYLSGYRFSMDAVRPLLRAVAYAGRMEGEMETLVTANPQVEVARFDAFDLLINHTDMPQRTRLVGITQEITLGPMAQLIRQRTN